MNYKDATIEQDQHGLWVPQRGEASGPHCQSLEDAKDWVDFHLVAEELDFHYYLLCEENGTGAQLLDTSDGMRTVGRIRWVGREDAWVVEWRGIEVTRFGYGEDEAAERKLWALAGFDAEDLERLRIKVGEWPES